jgi:hypothetical protein
MESCYFQNRIEGTQREMSTLKQNLANLNLKTSKVRDNGDELVKILIDFSERCGTFDQQFNQNIKHFANCLSAIEDHRDCMVRKYLLRLFGIIF